MRSACTAPGARAQSGAGGDGEPMSSAKPKTVKNFKYQAGRQQRKFIELPVAAPADGGKGGDVILYVVRRAARLGELARGRRGVRPRC